MDRVEKIDLLLRDFQTMRNEEPSVLLCIQYDDVVFALEQLLKAIKC